MCKKLGKLDPLMGSLSSKELEASQEVHYFQLSTSRSGSNGGGGENYTCSSFAVAIKHK